MKQLLFIVVVVPFCSIALAHHSDAGMNLDAVVVVEGKVSEFSWRQPHAYIVVDTQENGETVAWEIELGAPNVLSRNGWSKTSLTIGDEVFVRVHPMMSGRKYGKFSSIERADGQPVIQRAATEEVEQATTDSLAGIWTADRALFRNYPGGFDGFFNAQLQLTEKGQQAKDSYDPLSAENPEASCVGRPTPAALVSTWIYLMQIDMSQADDVIVFRSEWFDETRTIYVDGRPHPDKSQTFATGHSIGRWEDDTLVVDTANFDDHRSPYQVGVPSGAQKHVVERYRLSEDGTRIAMEFMLEDPEYLAEPLLHARDLIYSPHLKMYFGGCDPEITRRFLNQATASR